MTLILLWAPNAGLRNARLTSFALCGCSSPAKSPQIIADILFHLSNSLRLRLQLAEEFLPLPLISLLLSFPSIELFLCAGTVPQSLFDKDLFHRFLCFRVQAVAKQLCDRPSAT
jgi:hypothetical protein